MAEIFRKKRHDALLLALAAGNTVRDAARLAGVSERTATRRVADPESHQRIAQLQAEMVARALGKMADAMSAAADTLRALLNARRETVRLGAARALAELTPKLRENVELEHRLAELERCLGRRKGLRAS